ncbi:glutamyl-tRNA reductase [Streptomyces filamentosus NRRL 15998]|uniref:Glutamyl-tRNA reductase n=1 Tax=Streptomyces filamentosus NRRL 15998 TaxID=457431 RepID=D6AM86_STRFL|nr:glutamyl-tRNA reductase [Streptomyces filamentosus NRRL 15998]
MSLLVVGLSHRSAPVSVLERASLAADTQAKLLQDTLAAEPATEAAVLATCNRIELYADVDKFHAGVAELSTLLAQHSGVGLEELTPYLYVHYEDRAVHHLFSVACGLDSMVVGEGQILGQIKDALARGQELHTAGRLLNDLFQQALRVGKRAHSETGIDRAGQSLVTFGLQQLAAGADPECWARGKRALVIGAGSMSSLAAATLARTGCAEVVVANRTRSRADRLVEILQQGDDTAVRARAVEMSAVGRRTDTCRRRGLLHRLHRARAHRRRPRRRPGRHPGRRARGTGGHRRRPRPGRRRPARRLGGERFRRLRRARRPGDRAAPGHRARAVHRPRPARPARPRHAARHRRRRPPHRRGASRRHRVARRVVRRRPDGRRRGPGPHDRLRRGGRLRRRPARRARRPDRGRPAHHGRRRGRRRDRPAGRPPPRPGREAARRDHPDRAPRRRQAPARAHRAGQAARQRARRRRVRGRAARTLRPRPADGGRRLPGRPERPE